MDSYEPDNTYTAAQSINIYGHERLRSIDPYSDQDWFYFDIPVNPYFSTYPYFYWWYPFLIISTEVSGYDDIQMWLFSYDGYLLAYSDNNGTSKAPYISGNPPYPGKYYIAVTGKGYEVIDQYSISVSVF